MAISEEINSPQPNESQINNDDELSASEKDAIDNVISTLKGIRAELESALTYASPEQRDNIQSIIATLSGNIKSLQSGKKGTLSAAIASASNAVNDAKKEITEEKQELSASVASYNNSAQPVSMSSADYDFFASTASENLTWYKSLNLSAKQFVATDLAFQFSKDFDLKTGFTAARVVSENTTLSNIKEQNIIDNLAAISEAKTYAKKNDDKELLNAMVAGEKLIKTRCKVNDYTFRAEWDKANSDGVITAEERKELINFTKQEAVRRKEDFKEIDTKVLGMFSKGEKKSIESIYTAATGDTTPTAGEMQKFIKKYEPKAENINHFAAVMNKHAPPGSSPEQIQKALQMMSPEVRKDGLIAMYQSRMQAAEMAYDIKEMMQNLSPEQQQKAIAEIQQLLKEGKKEEVIAMLETANGDKNLSQGIKEWINKSKGTEDLQKIVGSVLQVDNNPRAIRNFATEIGSVFATENTGFSIFDFNKGISYNGLEYGTIEPAQTLPKFEATSFPNKFVDMLAGDNFKAPEGVTATNINFSGVATTGMNKAGISKQSTMSLP